MDLREAFQMSERETVSIVGGGGKTTLLYRLGHETVLAGGKAIVTGTTRFTAPEGADLPQAVFAETRAVLLAALCEALEAAPLVVAGAGWGRLSRIMPVEPDSLADMAALPGVWAVIAEADGSSGRPFKAPAEHEPVVAPSTTLLLTVTGMDVIGQPLAEESVHRPEIVAQLTGAAIGSLVDEAMIAAVLLDPRGGRKGLPAGARWLPVLNKTDTPERLESARRLARVLRTGGAERVVIARAAHDPPVVEVI